MSLRANLLAGCRRRRWDPVDEMTGLKAKNAITSRDQGGIVGAEDGRSPELANRPDPVKTSTSETRIGRHQELVHCQDITLSVEKQRHFQSQEHPSGQRIDRSFEHRCVEVTEPSDELLKVGHVPPTKTK